MYRKSARPPPSVAGRLVVARTYDHEIAAQADRAHLESEGIAAYVIETASFNPALSAAAGGVRLMVDPDELDLAQSILGKMAPEEAEGDSEEAGAVRCPSCELPYCSFEKPHLRNSGGHGLAFLALPFLLVFGEKRWRCHRCGAVWSDPNEGPKEITRLKAGDPRPVFRLRRAHPGLGLVGGLVVGLFIGLVVVQGALGAFVVLLAAAMGTVVGRAVREDVCSVAECRAVLPPDAEECPNCGGGIAGRVRTAEEHYSAAADFRRELAGIRAEAQARKKARRKKAATSRARIAAG